MIDWNSVTKKDTLLIHDIVKRHVALHPTADLMNAEMDITAAHINTPLDLNKLLNADDFNFAHDMSGIGAHLNRNTGKLENCFLPRCALKQ